jgi:hypothetical protein
VIPSTTATLHASNNSSNGHSRQVQVTFGTNHTLQTCCSPSLALPCLSNSL